MRVPKLRFKADDGSEFPDWEEHRIDDACALNPQTEALDDEFYYMDLGSIDHGRWEAPEIVSKVDAPSRAQRVAAIDDVFFQSVRPYNMGHYHYVAAKDKQVVASTGYIQARMRNGSNAFLYQLFYEEKFNAEVNARCTGSNYPAINSRKFGEITVALPSFSEQCKIADLLSAVDDVIAAQQAEVDVWEQRKKGVMQKLFSQEVRFKADDGSDFPDWEEKTLGDLGEFIKGAPLSKADIAPEGNPMILYGELYTTYGEVAYEIARSTNRNVDDKYRSKIGDVLIPTSGETPEEISTATCVMKEGVILAGDLYIYRTVDEIDGRIMSYLLNHQANKAISCIAQGKSVVHVQAKELRNITVVFPLEMGEQRKIADCLASMDEVIQKAKDELAKWQELKKGLLQQMFV